ncbi:MAG: hypothetical protein QI199_02870, partial [Candidatus Korarchaeota archaeon]|nr:hypothetical protein [Candidatus Korarchaeota archaeon]
STTYCSATWRRSGVGRGKRLARGGLLATIGYILSPLSWWNDLFVNIPIAYVAASLVAVVFPGAFAEALAAAYLATNILGFLLMHWGAEDMAGRRIGGGRRLAYYVAVSAAYTALVLLLAEAGIVAPIQDLSGK